MRKLYLYFLLPLILLTQLTSCYKIRASKGGGEISGFKERKFDPSDIALPEGYKIELVHKGLTFPSAIAFDESGSLYVAEAGYSYGNEWTEPRLLMIQANGNIKEIAKGGKNGPWNGMVYREGNFYISEGGHLEGGKILKINKQGDIQTLVEGLPSFGDHHTNGPVFFNGFLYFGQGTATNSGVVGNDNYDFGWLKTKTDFHDIPCKDIVLSGINYKTENKLTEEEGDEVVTGVYLPYGTSSSSNQTIKGAIPCSGAIFKVPLDRGELELVAWGLRNPFGFGVSPENKLYVSENSFDERGSRPVWGSGDVIWEINEGVWYGWPDFAAGQPIFNDKEFKSPKDQKLKAVLSSSSYPNQPPKPSAILGVHSSACGMDFSKSEDFGHRGEAFIAEFGDMVPNVGKTLFPVGFKVSKVNVNTGEIQDFAVNKGKRNGPASWLNSGGLERPVAVKFDPEGKSLYVVDFGVMMINEGKTEPFKNTGVIWKITRK